MKKVMLVKVRKGSLKGRRKARKEWCPRRQGRSEWFLSKGKQVQTPKSQEKSGLNQIHQVCNQEVTDHLGSCSGLAEKSLGLQC